MIILSKYQAVCHVSQWLLLAHKAPVNILRQLLFRSSTEVAANNKIFIREFQYFMRMPQQLTLTMKVQSAP